MDVVLLAILPGEMAFIHACSELLKAAAFEGGAFYFLFSHLSIVHLEVHIEVMDIQ